MSFSVVSDKTKFKFKKKYVVAIDHEGYTEIMIISPVVLLVLDGWGITRNLRGNAIREAYTPALDYIAAFHPSLALRASGFSVGLLWGEPGNSEAGHTAIGTGRIVYHHLPRILQEIRNGIFFENPVLVGAIAHTKKYHSRLHIVGLVSGAAVHSYLEHLYALFELAQRTKTPTLLHVFTDGKDSPPGQALSILESVRYRISENSYPVQYATIMGRYYAMDHSGAWDRVESAYKTLTGEAGMKVGDLLEHVSGEYVRGVTDEFITPAASILGGANGEGYIRPNDAVIFFNFRKDGMRELVSAFALPDFDGFSRPFLQNLYIATFTQYEKNLPVGVAFSEPDILNPLSEVISRHGIKQLKIAESQKIAHLTYFFSGGREEPFAFESRSVLPSDPAENLALHPEMRADDISQEIVRAVERTGYECIIANLANADAAAHTGNYQTTMRAAEAVDRAVERIYKSIAHRRGALIITSDHGSAEELFNTRTGNVKTGHSENLVPLYFITSRNRFRALREEKELERRFGQPMGVLADIAPTILELLGVKKPPEITGRSLMGLL
ncbi:MAG: 2,3-bisphosphoglycerate-independent phosphoglycerate mutase [bacterium]|nr:2,3-bisphosphoglycerate-independent phosphoglycerate mutase [bacterium]